MRRWGGWLAVALIGSVAHAGPILPAAPPVQAGITSIEGQRWRIVAYFNGADLSAPKDSVETVRLIRGPFDQAITNVGGPVAMGAIGGGWRCGVRRGTYRLSRDTIELRVWARVYGVCHPTDLPQNAQILHALNGTRFVARDEDRVILRDQAGRTQIILAPSDN